MHTAADFTIIGAGVIGLMTARALRQSGATVTVIDQNAAGQESSWAGGGILLPLYPWRQAEAITRLVVHSLSLYPALMDTLLADTGIDPEWTPCGLLMTQNPDIGAATAWCQLNHIRYANATAVQLAPFYSASLNPLWLPDIAQARNPRLLQALKQDVLNKGVQLIEHCQVTGFTCQQDHINTLNTTQGNFSPGQLVIASGAWTSALFEQLIPDYILDKPQISPIKGQMLVFAAEPGLLPSIVLDGDRYLIPRRDGKILAGSTVEQAGFDKTATALAKQQLHSFATELMPTLAQYPIIAHWAGLRPGTAQGIPYIGKHPAISNLSINAGHFRNGLVMAPASAQMLADILLGRPTALASKPYQLGSPH